MAKGTTEKIKKKALGLMYALLIVGFGAAAISLVHWQLIEGEELKSAALEQSLRSTGLPAMRGTIYDATGTKVLAQSASVWTVVLEPHYLADNDNLRRIVANGLSEILELDAMELYERTGVAGSYYDVVERKVETDVRDRIVKFMEDNKISDGIRLIPDYKRYYPYGTVASNILGFTGDDNSGLVGLELYYEEELSGSAGRLVAAKNAFGTDMPFEYEQIVEAQDGYDLVLTIDETVQSVLEKYLAEGIEKFKIQNGAVAVMMDVDTGGILGLATHPNFDPNDPFTILDQNLLKEIETLPEGEERQEARREALNTQWRNKGVSDLYYPGSVYKMCTGSMGIEEGIITEDTTYTCKGYEKFEGLKDPIHCWNHSGHGTTTFREGLCNSCNPWFMHIGAELGPDVFCRYRQAFGFEDKTGIDLPGEAGSILHSREEMGKVELVVESFGQNFSITPIQMITASAAVANGGYLVRPHIVDRIVDGDGNIVKSADKSYRRQVISESTSATLSDILRQNVASGTARGGYVSGYRVCGKTGTSEKVDKHNQDLLKDPTARMTYIASYCGFAPAEDPKYALLVFFDEPDDLNNGGYTAGNAIAGPIFSAIMQELLPYLGVEVMYSEDEYNEQRDTVAPSVAGKTLGEALEELEEAGLEYDIIGGEDPDQRITEQIPERGTSVPQNGKVVLYTSGYDVNSTLTEVPDFFEMDLANAVFQAAISDLQVTINGSRDDDAVVMLQGIEPGVKVKKGTVVTLTFGSKVNTDIYTAE
ncbi:penicillin-binding transpeptidase domain-containing protein [Acutalibacter muris]|jgi:stage V sporulation protein D (sporulation-specific penicillin-binding protein)|uniref:penicillin-binding transpeptidase domain-containing protein n=1 Tax=Acutalibacter muris TaxID=1796620 RepID=UPI0026F3A2FB|nr:penicillin-binding transpeptidase domain-containing protein [Acutalibacter muris]